MSDNAYKFDLPKHHKSIIKVIGVGGGGSNAVNHMFNQGIKDVEFVVCNTDAQALKASAVPNKLQIGANLTEGLGAGANPDVGRNAALESREDIRDLLGHDTKMVFITAGMGGGTGTGAAPVIAKIAKEMDILTVGIVTAPFSFEGKKKFSAAQRGIDELKENCDTVLVILNDKLREIYGNLSIGNAFGQADNILTTAAKGIAEIITVAGYVNVDFQDVRTVMHNAGAAVMGSAQTKGDNRARRAAEEALSSPLLDNRDIMGAQKILLSIISGEQAELQMDELTEITEYIQEEAGEDAEVIFGHGVDQELEDYIRVTVIATGFDHEITGNAVRREEREVKRVMDLERPVDVQTKIFDDNPSDRGEITLKKEEENRATEEKEEKESYSSLDNRSHEFIVEKRSPGYEFERVEADEDDGEDDLFSEADTEMEFSDATDDDDFFRNDGMMDVDTTRSRLEEEKERRKSRLEAMGKVEMRPDEFKERLDVPAYLRRNVRFQSVPSSSESHVSKYNLNDDNSILGNNRYLHDNVD